ncbi:AMP-binding protein [Streptomyces kaniharaensis]|uniref:AMP-binding protein n=1 Tax=Streptomyces kaniharaensis TaxID=212423 RepID=A0A6N7KYC2_9ACTN|nr:AMP-binding protein [Streptomyces kaniharaensis]MQS15795.1 AMP-binding protein [Streptomyces kaniharaensis]
MYTEASGSRWSLIHSLLDAVRRHHSSVAVVDRGVEHSYAELDRLSGEIAGGFAARGLGPGSLVAVHGHRSWTRCAAVLGAWRAGAGVVCVDPGMPAPRAAKITRFSDLVLHADGAGPTGPGGTELTVDEVRGNPLEVPREGPVGYVIPTSGSTGEPKSVAVPPGVLAALGDWHVRHWSHDRPPHTLQVASIGFDVGYEELVATWLAGARLVVVDDDQRQDPFTLMDVIREHRVARLFLPVVGLHALATAAAFEPDAMPDLREIAVAGERLVVNAEVRGFCASGGITLVNEYGPSETHVVTQYRLAPHEAADWPDHPPIGRAIAGAELLRHTDGVLRPFAPGEEAELMVAGGSVGIGYLGDQELTDARFRTLPHDDGAPRRCYATGDLVRFDGTDFHFVARADDQLKVNGYRVEPGEVEAVLNALPGVRRAVVVAVEVAGSRRLAAAYTRTATDGTQPEQLAAHCAAHLPAYMVPKHFHALEELPVTANGKVDRAGLRALFGTVRTA